MSWGFLHGPSVSSVKSLASPGTLTLRLFKPCSFKRNSYGFTHDVSLIDLLDKWPVYGSSQIHEPLNRRTPQLRPFDLLWTIPDRFQLLHQNTSNEINKKKHSKKFYEDRDLIQQLPIYESYPLPLIYGTLDD